MPFAINFNDKPAPKAWIRPGDEAELGEIIINDFTESLTISTKYWTRHDYIQQWFEAVKRISASDNARAVLITDFLDDSAAPYAAELWPLYRNRNTIYIQNYYPSPEEVKYPLTAEGIYASLRERSKNVSEWTISVQELEQWAEKLPTIEVRFSDEQSDSDSHNNKKVRRNL